MGFPHVMLVGNANNLTYLAEDIYSYHDAKAYEEEDDYDDDYDEDDGYY